MITVQPKGGFKNIKEYPLKNWRAECPQCSHIEIQEGDGAKCPNCNSDVQATYGTIFSNSSWESEEARKSWRKISCVKKCGWSVNIIQCSKCGADIQGDFFKGTESKITTNCFVATSAFNGALHPTVSSLQLWRDNFLMPKKQGRRFIAFYYRHGPKWASQLDRFSFLKPVVRKTLTAMIKLMSISKKESNL
jgi:hypothetical protein